MILPYFKDLENFFTQIKNALKERKYGPLVLYFVVIVIVVSLFAFNRTSNPSAQTKQSNTIIGNNASVNQVMNINTPPPFELEYTAQKENIQEDNLYKTVFEVSIKRLQGNFQKGFYIMNGGNLSKADCSKPEEIRSEAEVQNGRQIYEKVWYKIECTSEVPIIDNEELFTVFSVDR